jgi:hypothetical protein
MCVEDKQFLPLNDNLLKMFGAGNKYFHDLSTVYFNKKSVELHFFLRNYSQHFLC